MTPSSSPARRLAQLFRLDWLVVLALLAILAVGLAMWRTLLDHQEAEATAARQSIELRAQQMNEAVSQQVDSKLRSIDTALKHLRASYVSDHNHFDRAAKEVLSTYPPGMFQFITVFGPDGYLAYSSSGIQSNTYFGDREHFRVHTTGHQDQLFISRPVVGRLAGIPLIQITRPIWDDEHFLGVLVISLRPDYLAQKLAALHTDQSDLIAVMRNDGTFVTRTRALAQALETHVPPERPYLLAEPGTQGMYRDLSTVDKVPLLFSWRKLSEWPLSVVVAVNEESQLGPLRERHAHERQRMFIGVAMIVALLLLLAVMVTRLQRSHSLLADSEARQRSFTERFQLAVDGVNDGIWDWNLQTDEVYYSPKLKEMLGYSDEQMANTHAAFQALVHPEDVAVVQEALRSYLSREVAHYVLECRLRHQDGSWRWILRRGEALRDASGQPYRMAGSHTDITERKAQEQQLQEMESLLRSAMEATGEAFVIFDEQDHLVFCNEEYRQLFKTSLPAIQPGALFSDIVDYGLQRGQYRDALGVEDSWREQRLQAHYSGTHDFITQLDSGKWLQVKERRSSTGHIVGFRVDVTELYLAKQAAESANVAKSQFLSTMSHEIRTPMNGVLGMLQLLEHTLLTSEQRDYVSTASDSGRGLLRILNDILDFSKIESGRLEIEETSFSLLNTLNEVLRAFEFQARQKDLWLSHAFAEEIPLWVIGDPTRLRQVLVNLLGNALKFTQQGGVSLRVNLLPGSRIEFCVQDTGIGIEPAALARLFTPFTQGDSSITRTFGGTGLGLSISKRLVELMGGDLSVHSVPGEGSEFKFVLHLIPSSPPDLKGEYQAYHSPLAGKRVLLVEDNLTNQKVVVGMLLKQEIEVSVANHGAEALACLGQQVFDLVLMDCRMPVMDGLEATRRIRSGMQQAQIPVVALTANAMQADREECLAAGMNDFLGKPVSMQDLTQVLHRWLDSQHDEPSLESSLLSVTPAVIAIPDDLPVFSLAAMLKLLGGDEALARDIVPGFFVDLSQAESELAEYLDHAQYEDAQRDIHTLKGLAAQMGGRRLHWLMQAMEQHLQQGGSLEGVWLEACLQESALLKAELQEWLQAN